MKIFILAFLSIAISVAAQFCLKAGMSSEPVKQLLAQPLGPMTLVNVFLNRYVFAGFFLYGLGAAVWLSVLAKWDVSKAYPMVGIGFVLSLCVGYLLGEDVTLQRAIGVMLICAGVYVVARS